MYSMDLFTLQIVGRIEKNKNCLWIREAGIDISLLKKVTDLLMSEA